MLHILIWSWKNSFYDTKWVCFSQNIFFIKNDFVQRPNILNMENEMAWKQIVLIRKTTQFLFSFKKEEKSRFSCKMIVLTQVLMLPTLWNGSRLYCTQKPFDTNLSMASLRSLAFIWLKCLCLQAMVNQALKFWNYSTTFWCCFQSWLQNRSF